MMNASARPRGYPADWERLGKTLDGVEYGIRPIRPDDTGREQEFFRGLSQESRYRRMMAAIRELPPALVERFVNVDYKRDMAFVAVVGNGADERIIGVARYAADGRDSDCEFAVAVSDAWQGRGVGATLTRMLFAYAHLQGVRKLHGDIQVSNNRMIELVHWLGMETHRLPGDPTLIEATTEL